MLYKDIHIGQFIKERVEEMEVPMDRICNFLNKDVVSVENMYNSKSIDTDLLLRWCKLLEYDFFRIYSSHLIYMLHHRQLIKHLRNLRKFLISERTFTPRK
jgi:hypothetical protein